MQRYYDAASERWISVEDQEAALQTNNGFLTPLRGYVPTIGLTGNDTLISHPQGLRFANDDEYMLYRYGPGLVRETVTDYYGQSDTYYKFPDGHNQQPLPGTYALTRAGDPDFKQQANAVKGAILTMAGAGFSALNNGIGSALTKVASALNSLNTAKDNAKASKRVPNVATMDGDYFALDPDMIAAREYANLSPSPLDQKQTIERDLNATPIAEAITPSHIMFIFAVLVAIFFYVRKG